MSADTIQDVVDGEVSLLRAVCDAESFEALLHALPPMESPMARWAYAKGLREMIEEGRTPLQALSVMARA